jgi:multisubunit Na+/H+ antiporter MnhG subunit
MSHPILTTLFLATAVLVVWASCLGLLLMRSPLARLHYLGPVSLLAPLFVAAAVLTEEGLGQAGLKALMVAVMLLVQGPVMAHILGRAMSIRQGKAPDREGRY